MYTTVPAAHLILVDDHTEKFQFDENLSVNGTFFQSFEPELFMTEEFVDDRTVHLSLYANMITRLHYNGAIFQPFRLFSALRIG